MTSVFRDGFNVLQDEGLIAFTRKSVTYACERYREVLFRTFHGDGVDVMAEDWDNLLLLDACRFDVFREVNDLEGRLEKRLSGGSTSREFIEHNFRGGRFHDTVYVTANPYVKDIEPGTFHAVVSLLNEWDEDRQTVTPDSVREAVEEVYREYEDKRIVVHFMHPHQPYLGATAASIEEKASVATEIRGWDTNLQYARGENGGTVITHLDAAKRRDIAVSNEEVRAAYRETLSIVLDEVKKLTDVLDGKTVISSDDGEFLGDRCWFVGHKRYGHPRGSYMAKLREVPWFIIDSDHRREIVAEESVRHDEEYEQLERKLEHLGYK